MSQSLTNHAAGKSLGAAVVIEMLDGARSSGWLLENVQLCGLDDTDRAHSLLLCVRELFENALDACMRPDTGNDPCTRTPVAKAHHIAVTVAPVYEHPGLYAVNVTDDGRGFSEEQLEKVGVLCSGETSGPMRTCDENASPGLAEVSDQSAGVLGGGLNTVLLWAHLHGGQPVTITSAGSLGGVPNEVLKLRAALQVRQSPTGSPGLDLSTKLTRLKQVASTGTRVSCVLAGGVGNPAVAEHLESYFACVASLCVCSELRVTLNLLLEGDSAGAASDHMGPQGHVFELPAMPFDRMWLQAEPVPTIDGAINQLRELALKFGSDLRTTHGVGKAIVEYKGAAAAKGFVHATLLLGAAHSAPMGVCTPSVAADLAPSPFAYDDGNECHRDEGFGYDPFDDEDNRDDPDHLWRRRQDGDAAVHVGEQRHEDVDHAPQGRVPGYLTTAEEGGVSSTPCQPSKPERLSSSPLRVLVFLNNKPLRVDWGEPPAQCATFAALRKVSWKAAGLGLRTRPLQLVSGHTPLRGAWAIVHLCDPAARFGDLGKSTIQPSKPLTKAISAAVTNALEQARQGWAESGLLLSAEERWRRQLGRSAEHIARSVSGLIAVLRHANERRDCLHLLGAVDTAECEGVVRGCLRREWQHTTHTQAHRRLSKPRPSVVVEGDDDFYDYVDPSASLASSPEEYTSGAAEEYANANAHTHVRCGAWYRRPSSFRSSTAQAAGRKRGTPFDFEHGDDAT